MAYHSRNQSSLSTVNPPRTCSTIRPLSIPGQAGLRPSSNESELPINGSTSSEYLGRNAFNDLQIAEPPKAASPPRPALGARLLSSLSTAQPASPSLARKGSVLHSRAKSLASLVPKLNPSNTSTPEKTQTHKLLDNFFGGESAPIKLGAPVSPTKEKSESEFVMEYRPTLTERPGSVQRRQAPTQSVANGPAVTKPSSWFSRKTTNPTPTKQQSQDELSILNINASLFPNGPADPLDPSAFNELLINATNLLQRMQLAYREKVDYISSIRPEIDASKEEVEEAETRAAHLKMQLEEMSHQTQQQEITMKEMATELADERMKVLEAREAANTIRLVPHLTQDDPTPSRRKRASIGDASDSGFESDLDSVFSAHSGGDTPLSPPMSRHHMSDTDSKYLNTSNWQATARPNTSCGNGNRNLQRLGREGAAWATVEALRGENAELRKELDEMHVTLQGCIDLVSDVHGA